ncbi:hypothetical protein [Kaarinaea lacus]
MEVPVAPNSVRVWWGYRASAFAPDTKRNEFYEALGSVFIPATVQMMTPLGMTAYLPSVLPTSENALPDEIALVFYEEQQTYDTAVRDKVTGRAYGKLHGTTFNFSGDTGIPPSGSDFPRKYLGEIVLDKLTPYYLFDEAIDWQVGSTFVYAGQIKHACDDLRVRQHVNEWLQGICASDDNRIDGFIFLLSKHYLLCWQHSPSPMNSLIRGEQLLGFFEPVLQQHAINTPIPLSPITDYSGVSVRDGTCLNTQFTRRASIGY